MSLLFFLFLDCISKNSNGNFSFFPKQTLNLIVQVRDKVLLLEIYILDGKIPLLNFRIQLTIFSVLDREESSWFYLMVGMGKFLVYFFKFLMALKVPRGVLGWILIK